VGNGNRPRRGSSDSPKEGRWQGCRTLRDEEYEEWLVVCGEEPGTEKEVAPLLARWWERTSQKIPDMRKLLIKLVLDSTAVLGFVNFIHYYPDTIWLSWLCNFDFGFSLDDSYYRSHLGLTITAIWYLKTSKDEAALRKQLDDTWDESNTHTPGRRS